MSGFGPENPNWRGGKTQHPLYRIHHAMVDRCTNPTDKGYPNYGGRGITVCARWVGREGFWNFVADMGDRPAGYSLDRIDNDGNYEPDNCQWADAVAQANNRRERRRHRSPHCPSGHEWNAENTRWVADGRYRACRACDREAVARRRAAKKQVAA